jgi:hypothetical protein
MPCFPTLFHCAPRQKNPELSKRANLAIDLNRAAVLLGHNLVADREPKSSALSGRFGSHEGLEELISDLWRNAGAIIPYPDLDGLAQISR